VLLLPFFQWCCSGREKQVSKKTTIPGSVGVFIFPSLCFRNPFLPFSPFTLLSFNFSHLHFSSSFNFPTSLPSFFFPLFSFKRALSRPKKKSSSAAGVESSIYRLEGCGLLLRVGSRGAACWSARQGAWGFRFSHCSMF